MPLTKVDPKLLGGGTVLQVVNATYGTKVEVSSSTYADTGLTASITPTSVTSKILVVVNVNGIGKYVGNTFAAFRVLRGATQIIQFEGNAGENGGASTNLIGGSGTNYLDSPSTTSATTYKVQIKSTQNIAWAAINDSGSTSTITLMEIAG